MAYTKEQIEPNDIIINNIARKNKTGYILTYIDKKLVFLYMNYWLN